MTLKTNDKGQIIIPSERKITGYKVLSEEPEQIEEEVTEPVGMHEGVKRPHVLLGKTYKIHPPGEEHSLYLTINHIELDGELHPYEVFINSAKMESFQWIVLATRIMSAVFRKGGNITFIADELEAIFDPTGGYFGKDHIKNKGKYFNSVLAEIGFVLRQHFTEMGLLKPVHTIAEEKAMKSPKEEIAESGEVFTEPSDSIPDGYYYMENITCEDCGGKHFRNDGGCPTCVCGWSKCS